MPTERIIEGDFRQETGGRICQEMFLPDKRWPSALFVSNNLMAVGALEALSRLNFHCPVHFALATFDGFVFPDAFHPTLTTVVQPAYEIGVRGAEILIQRLNGELRPDPISVELPTELRLKESSLRTYSTTTEVRKPQSSVRGAHRREV